MTRFEFASNLLVQWKPLSQYYAHGKILGYTIYYRDLPPYQSVNTSSPYPTRFTLKNLKPGQRYGVRVAAFTSKGVGPSTYSYYVTTGMILSKESLFILKLRDIVLFSPEEMLRREAYKLDSHEKSSCIICSFL